jgi:plasmid segregation protein ParM
VSADGEVARYVEVGRCQVLPQALGAYVAALSADGSLARGRYGVVDVGFRTTDLVLLVPNADGVPVPDDARSGSVDAGIGLAYEAVRQQVERESGVLVDEGIVMAALRGDGVLRVRGAARDLRVPFGKGARSLAERVEAAVRRLWADQLEFLDALLLAGGGGAALLPALGLPGMRPVEGGMYANAEGFLRQMAVSGRMA